MRGFVGVRGAAALLLMCGASVAQADRVVGLVRGPDGAPLAGMTVRAFARADDLAAWRRREVASGAIAAATTDARGRFSLPCDERVALWGSGDGLAAFVAEAAPGVPAVLHAVPAARAQLEPDARGAHVRIGGVPVGFVAGSRLELPAAAIELLVECDGGDYTCARRFVAGDGASMPMPGGTPAVLRGVPSDGSAVAVLESWPQRRLAPDRDGVIRMPKSSRALAVTVSIAAGPDDGADRVFERLWVEAGAQRDLATMAADWRALRVVDPDGRPVPGARVWTVRSGPGLPAAMATSTTDADGVARHRVDVPRARVVVDARGFALCSVAPIDLERAGSAIGEVVLQPGCSVQLHVSGQFGVPLAGAEVRTVAPAELVRQTHTDGRGGARLDGLERGSCDLIVEHPDHVPVAVRVQTPSEERVRLVLPAGRTIRGRVESPDGFDPAEVLIDVVARIDGVPTRRRRVTVAPAGTFEVRGLGDLPVDLFAHRVRRGVTWSGRADRVEPGSDDVVIVVRCDDPQPAGG